MRHDALDGALMRAIGDAMRAQANYSTYTSQAVANVLQVAAWDEGTPLPEDVLDGLAERALGAMEEFVPRTYPALMVCCCGVGLCVCWVVACVFVVVLLHVFRTHTMYIAYMSSKRTSIR